MQGSGEELQSLWGFIPQSLVLRSIFLVLILIIGLKLVYHLFGCNIRSEGTSCSGNLISSGILSSLICPLCVCV